MELPSTSAAALLPLAAGLLIGLPASLAGLWLGRRLELVDSLQRDPDGRPIPRAGGVAILLTWLAVSAPQLQAQTAWVLGLSAAAWAMGLHDDFTKSSPRLRLAILVGLSLTAAALGIRIEAVVIPGSGAPLALGVLAIPLSAAWILGTTVAFDFIDGLDGLASGLVLLACGGLLLIGGDASELALVAGLAGATAAFHTVNHPPARAYMGDNGSNMLGFALGSLSLLICTEASGAFLAAPALLLIAVPVLDATLTLARRAGSTKSVFSSDTGHIHHRLLLGGHSTRQALSLLLLAAASCAAAGVALATRAESGVTLLLWAAVAASLGYLLWEVRR